MPTDNNIRKCQTQDLHYLEVIVDAQKRMEQGQQQVFCLRCSRWKWPDKLCDEAEVKDS